MKTLTQSVMLAAACGCLAGVAHAGLRLLPAENPVCIFSGKDRNISLTFSNSNNQDFEADIRARLFQTTSATAVQTDDVAWKVIHILPQQTVLESTRLDFPTVKAETKFLVQWLEDSNHVIGTTTVWVYPTNVLAELKPLLDGGILGALDPNNELKPLLRQNGVKFVDLEETKLENFSGGLAIIGPFSTKELALSDLPKQIKKLAKNVPVVWVQPPPRAQNQPVPSFYLVRVNTNAVVVVQSNMVSNLPDNPRAQLNLIYFCKLALHPQPPVLPDESAKP